MATPSTAKMPDQLQKLHLPQELIDLIYDSFAEKRQALILRRVCRTFATGLFHRIIDVYENLNTFANHRRLFHDREFTLYIDEPGIGSIEALVHPQLATLVRHIVLADRSPVNYRLEATCLEDRDDWLDERDALAAQHQQVVAQSDSLVIRNSPGVWERPHDPVIGRPHVVLRNEGSNPERIRDDASGDLESSLSRIAFQTLRSKYTQVQVSDHVHDYTIREISECCSKHFDLRPSAETLARFRTALSAFVNLESIRTETHEVVIVTGLNDGTKETLERTFWSPLCLPLSRPAQLRCTNVVWPAVHNFAAIMSPTISQALPALTITRLELGLYCKDNYPSLLPSAQNVFLMTKLMSRCSRLAHLCLRPGHDPGSHHEQMIAHEMRHFLRCMAAANPMPSLRYLELHQTEPTSQDLAVFLRQHQSSLREVHLLGCENSQGYSKWIGLLVLAIDELALEVMNIEFLQWAYSPFDYEHFYGPGPRELWSKAGYDQENLADKALCLKIVKRLREEVGDQMEVQTYRPEDF